MVREEKGNPSNPTGSYEDSPAGGSTANAGGSSLAARRARLRGTLARAAFPADEEFATPATEPTADELAGAIATAAPVAEEAPPPPFNPAAAGIDLDSEPAIPAFFTESTPPPVLSASVAAALQPLSQQSFLQDPSSQQQASPDPFSQEPFTQEPVAQEPFAQQPYNQQPYAAEPFSQEPYAAEPFVQEPYTEQPFSQHPLSQLANVPEQAMDTLNNIDSALNACATNLSALQRLAGEQTEVLKGLSSTLQNQTLFEIGLNLNSLTESLTAALEPMKAMGELVPAMDQLVATLEGREADSSNERLSPDQLVTSLADQLSAGLIDPWTFKCAYMAIYPAEHPADLLHRLVELLGTQRLSGDLFRSAYEAVQGAEAPGSRGSQRRARTDLSEIVGLDEEIRGQIEDLQRANEDLQQRQDEREAELRVLLTHKDSELQEAQELLNSRYDEFNSRYEEVADALNKREEEYRALLESKDMELVEKESELNLLRAQMEELSNQTEDMVKDLHTQLADMKVAKENNPPPAPTQSGFFDPTPQPAANNLFQNAQQKQLFDQQEQTNQQPLPVQQTASMPSVQQPQQQQQQQQQFSSQVTTQQMSAQQIPANMVPQPPSGNQPPPAQPTQQQRAPGPQPAPGTPFTPGAGSYGSGVRAQVFEVIVRQALAGAPWREICAGPMQVNNISPEEVEAEVKRRQALLNK